MDTLSRRKATRRYRQAKKKRIQAGDVQNPAPGRIETVSADPGAVHPGCPRGCDTLTC